MIANIKNTKTHHLYADDTQMNVAFTIPELQKCLQSVQDWKDASKLKLNPDTYTCYT